MTAHDHRSWLTLGLSLLLASCSSTTSGAPEGTSPQPDALVQQRRTVVIDGSSTVFPITEAIAAAYNAEANDPVEVDVGFSGTGGGFKKFCAGQTDISNASRPITTEEMAACDTNDVRFYELPVAFDALTVVVNPQNTWANDITVAELKTMWSPGAQGRITNWSQVRPGWPDQPLTLFGPGLDSGTYDYFADVVVGQATRSDFVASEDDDLLVRGVAQTPGGLGYFGLAYFEDNSGSLKALAVDSGSGPVVPTVENVVQSTYQPLARPLFIYVNYTSAQRNPAVREFIEYYLQTAPTVVEEVGYIPLTEEAYNIALVNFHQGEAGTVFDGQPQPNLTLGEVLRKTKRIN
ncbi:PstS family phosphate ABC transporter substrate-binding protein [Nodosilinea sp. LEGE 07088]|uniref:PstS family phosphate ABC transporter substrate-binding protein n=1 Tax=Nodosilinea sp. LEGE 07088 TaxID=2777968 RepID=UPI001881012B|nr:PstS family phosphate ABC transporter substrate-binding protein [Nodosilinea sp. LEGE 07088]MBE9139098.1 PstS family phosphate ABC transporter substrate-binding protein [Nodosilinea sp. LEGE 07088]